MRIKIINTEKIRNKYVKEALKEYTKRLSTYCKMEYIETKNPEKEISSKTYIIKINNISGEELSSEQLAEKIEQLGISGNSHITILLGADNIEADYILSISRMDIDINILLIIIYEQIYRAYRIINSAPYHK